MTGQQVFLFVLLGCVFVFLLWGRWRYDLVAFAALCVALLAGVVPVDQAFSGFGHPATVIVALVLIVSRALSNSGVVEWIGRYAMAVPPRRLITHISVMSGVAAALSAVMNNVAALALLMPVDLEASAKAERSPALTLMPLSFATILGGMITLIGTPPNIIIAQFRAGALGRAYSMFDFAPVGIACAVAGIAFVTLIGRRLIPSSRAEHDSAKELFTLAEYIAEVQVPEQSSAIGKRVEELDGIADENGVQMIDLVRRGQRLAGMARRTVIRAGDLLVLEAAPEGIDKIVGALGLDYRHKDASASAGDKGDQELALSEVVVPQGARIEKRSAMSLRLFARHDVSLLGVSRQGTRFRERVRKLPIEAGDVLLLLGPRDRLQEAVTWVGCLPLAERGLRVLKRDKALLAVSIFTVAVGAAALRIVPLEVSLACAVVLLIVFKAVPLRELYESVEWPIVILLGSMIPIGSALESTGGTRLIADGLVDLSQGMSPTVVLVLLMAVTMTLSDIMNNTATAVIAAPVAVDIANRLHVSADPFLMSVAVAASCAFLTPIGHKNNTLIMGPGGYRFGDYWRMGLPLELLVIAVGVPTILHVWPM